MRIIITVITFFMMASWAANAYAGPLDYLNGRWAGWGKLYTANGASQRLKCVTTYKTANGGQKAKQNFRCTSSGYRFSTVLNYSVRENTLSGGWKEQIYSAGGKVQGRNRPGNLAMTLFADTFTANVAIKSSKCTQLINVRLKGDVGVSRFNIQLRRC